MRLLAQARVAGFARLVLSVNPENPAQRLYRRCGFRDLPPGNPHAGTSILMAVELQPSSLSAYGLDAYLKSGNPEGT
jgi:ribosomal protein S18 acetylase RimI-like enzyme